MIKKVKKACGYFLYVFLCGWLPHYQLHYKWPISNKLRELAAKLMFEYCGSNVDIGRKISFSQSISLGSNSGIGDNAYFIGKTSIGKNVIMAANCAFIASTHESKRVDIPIKKQGGNEKAEYSTGLLKELSKQMAQDFGKGFTVANLKNMRQFNRLTVTSVPAIQTVKD